MSTWSTEDWRADGVSLKDWAYSIAVLGGLDSSPPRRGENTTVAYYRGKRWQPKQYDEVTRTLLMWVDGREHDGSYPVGVNARRARVNANIRELMALFAKQDAPLTIERDVLLPTGTETWTALAESTTPVILDYEDGWSEHAALSVDLLFADPLWYGPSTSASVGLGASVTFTNGGEVAAESMTVTFNGPLTNPLLTNLTSGVYVSLGVTIAGGDSVVVDVAAASAFRTSDGANLIGAVTHSGSRSFMRLLRGANLLTLSGSGSGYATVAYRPPRL